MKKLTPVICCLLALCFSNCKKDKTRLNITLYDKPISVIQTYLLGKWRVHYMRGGFCGTCTIDRSPLNEYLDFLPNNRIIYSVQNEIVADTTIQWLKYSSPWNPIDTIKVLVFFDKKESPNFYEPYEIRNDTLIFITPDHLSPDNNSWEATKSN